MKIANIISETDKAVFFERTAEELREKELDVIYILINCQNGALSEFLHKNGFKVWEFENKRLLKSRKTIGKVRRILKDQKIDLIHCHLSHANWVGLWAGKLAGVKKRIYTRHSGAPLVPSIKEKRIDKIQNRLATKVVSISQNIDDILTREGAKKKKRKLIHHGFDLERFAVNDQDEVERIKNTYNPSNKYPVVGVIARWMEWKGIHYIIGGFKELLKTHPDALLCLFGGNSSGDYYNQLIEQLKELPEESYRIVEFEPNVFDLYRLFDVYVHVPVNQSCEAFGQTYIEALAAGVPSVFTLSGVAREFVRHEENALVVPYCDKDAIAESIRRILETPELRETIVANGKKDVAQKFSFDQYIRKLIQMYES